GELLSALEPLKKANANDPDVQKYYLEALHYRAEAQMALDGDQDAAEKDLLAARELDPGFVPVRLLLSVLYRRTQRFGDASLEFADLLHMYPGRSEIRKEYVDFLLALTEIQQKLPPESREDIADTIRRLDPAQTLDNLIHESVKAYPEDIRWVLAFAELKE